MKALARGAEAAITIGTGVAIYRIVLISAKPFAAIISEGVNGRPSRIVPSCSRPETGRVTDGNSRSLGAALGPGAARAAPARLLDDSAQAPVADPHFSADSGNSGHHRFFQDEAGVSRRRRAWKWTENRRTCCPFPERNSYDEYEDTEATSKRRPRFSRARRWRCRPSSHWTSDAIRNLAAIPTPSLGRQPAPSPRRPAILGAFPGTFGVRRVPNSRLIEVTFRSGRSAARRADRQRAPAELHRAEFPQQIRRHHAGFHLAFVRTGRAAHQGGEIGRRANRVRARKIRSGKSTKSRTSPPEARGPEQGGDGSADGRRRRRRRFTAWRFRGMWMRCRRSATTRWLQDLLKRKVRTR